MLKNKRILLILIIALALFLIPSVCNAAAITAIQTTPTSTGGTVKWSYELEGESIINLKCTNKSEISGEVVIPSELDGHKVTSFSEGYSTAIFKGCDGLTGVTIPSTISKIGNYAFENCTSLNKVTIPNGVLNIGTYAFEDTGLTNITMPESVIKIDNYAFANCSSLNNVVLNNGLINIGEYAFEDTGIISITIPNSVTSIGEHAFNNCTALTKVTLSEKLTRLNEGVFANCKGLTSLRIPNGVTTIASGAEYSGDGAFVNCVGLTKVLIPDSVVTIQDWAFKGCNNLTIYGNDNQASKEYAEKNDINFNYIADWDKAPAGKDNKPPKLESLEIAWSTAFEHDKGTGYYLASVDTNISIKATFDEKVYGNTSPTLTIKCGNGENIALNNGVIKGEYIVYTYRIQNKDKGIITAVSLIGGDIADEAGNKVEKYTCPELVTDIWGENVFANGVGSIVNNQGGQNNQGSQGNQNGNQQTVTLSSIAITKAPTKTSYKVGETFNKAGMVITATYSNGSKKEITNYTISPSVALKLTDKKVVIIYNENGVTKSAEQKITVTAKVTNDTTNKGNTPSKDDTQKDSTIKGDNKLPQTGVTVISLVAIILLAVALISKVRYGKLKDI